MWLDSGCASWIRCCTYVVAFLTVGVGTVAMVVGTSPGKPVGQQGNI